MGWGGVGEGGKEWGGRGREEWDGVEEGVGWRREGGVGWGGGGRKGVGWRREGGVGWGGGGAERDCTLLLPRSAGVDTRVSSSFFSEVIERSGIVRL